MRLENGNLALRALMFTSHAVSSRDTTTSENTTFQTRSNRRLTDPRPSAYLSVVIATELQGNSWEAIVGN